MRARDGEAPERAAFLVAGCESPIPTDAVARTLEAAGYTVRLFGPLGDVHRDVELARRLRSVAPAAHAALVATGSGAAAALSAAAQLGSDLGVLVVLGGRGALPWARLAAIRAPTLLVVRSGDLRAIEDYAEVARALMAPVEVRVFPDERFEIAESETAVVVEVAVCWLRRWARGAPVPAAAPGDSRAVDPIGVSRSTIAPEPSPAGV